MRRSLAVAILCLTLPGIGAAQHRAGARWITEASYLARISGRGDAASTGFPGVTASLEFGRLWGVTPKVAVGAGFSATLLEGIAFGIRPRVRYWLSPTSSLDLAPGLLVAGVAGPPRFTADLALMRRDQFGVTLQSFVMSSTTYYPDGRFTTGNRVVVYGGLKLGSNWGRLAAAADGLAILAAFAAYFIACGGNNCD